MPYLAAPAVDDVIAALNEYDEAFATVSEGFVECLGLAATASATCRARDYRPGPLHGRPRRRARPRGARAVGACRAALGRAASTRPHSGSAPLRRGSPTSTAAGASPGGAGRHRRAGPVHRPPAQLVQVATMCVPPQDYASLGDDGVMLIDSASSLIPPLDG